MNRREKISKEIKHEASKNNLSRCPELCFKCFYGLPPEIQIPINVEMLKRYLSIFESRNVYNSSPRILLKDIDSYVLNNKMEIEGQDGDFNTADSAFMYGLESLLFAYSNQTRQDILATSCASSIKSLINAFGFNVWEADDPEGVRAWRAGEGTIERSSVRNVASVAVESREWKNIVSLLIKHDIFSVDDRVTISEMNDVFEEWKQNEMLLMMHKIRES